jgi:hypothetical protein
LTRITLPSSQEDAVEKMGGIVSLLDKSGWKAGAFIACSVKLGTRGGDTRSIRTSPNGRLAASTFAKKLNAKGWSDKIVARHYKAWEAAAEAGVVPHADELVYGEAVEVPTEGWAQFYPPAWESAENAEDMAAAAEAEGIGASKVHDIAKNTKALTAAIKASPKAREAAAAALAGTQEATEIAATVMASPEQAEIVIGDPVVYESVITAQGRHLAGQRKAHTPTARPSGTGRVIGVGSILTLGVLLGDLRVKLDQLAHFVDNGLEPDAADLVRTFITDEALLILNGLMVHPTLTGVELRPEDFA